MAMDQARQTAAQAAGNIRLLGLDVDGTLTDGGLYFGNDGEVMKRFSVFDGQGLRLLMDHGVKVVWITARSSLIVEKRARDLGIHSLVQGCKTKLDALDKIRQELGLEWSQCAFFGDDWPDYPVLKSVGLACTTPHSPEPMKAVAHWLNTRPTGQGAVRELCDFILSHQAGYINPWMGA
ncbi:MAG TPA: HAD-IIIA family hydrolase [Limnobacter sp.]|uniref:KdsC family phosphatase n=1 Tax=Limnobacter sp. TaxID=2003368 RepID=UPI002ED8D2D6